MIRVEDKAEDAIADDKRVQEKKARSHAEHFKQSMLSRVQTPQGRPKTKATGKDKDKSWKEAASLKSTKKTDTESDAIQMDSILRELESSEGERDAHPVLGRRDRRSSTSTAKKDNRVKEEKQKPQEEESNRQLPTAVVGQFGSRDSSGGSSFTSSDDSGRQHAFTEPDWEEELGTPAFPSAKTVEKGHRIAIPSLAFKDALQSRSHRHLPKALLEQVAKRCRVILESAHQSVVELTLSRHLFDGMTIRLSAEKSATLTAANTKIHRLKIEFITASKDIAQFFQEKRDEIVTELAKRGLAVDPKHVIVSTT